MTMAMVGVHGGAPLPWAGTRVVRGTRAHTQVRPYNGGYGGADSDGIAARPCDARGPAWRCVVGGWKPCWGVRAERPQEKLGGRVSLGCSPRNVQ